MIDDGDDERSTNAILDWLGASRETKKGTDIARQLNDDPLAFLQHHLHLLPTHLLEIVGERTSRRQRGTLATIRDRRRRFAETVRPDALTVDEGRKRNPLLYKDVTGGSRPLRTAASSRPAADLVTRSAQASESLATPEQVMSRPRFSALVQRFDEQDVAATLQRQEELRAESTAETEEVENIDERSATHDADEDAESARSEAHDVEAEFGRQLLAQFVRGDDDGLPDDVYLCDYDEQWDGDTSPLASTRRGVMRALNSEERWFDEEEPS